MLDIAKPPLNLFDWVFQKGGLLCLCVVWHIALRDSVVASRRYGFVVPSRLFTPYPVQAFPLSLIPTELNKFAFCYLSSNGRSNLNRLHNFDFFFNRNLGRFADISSDTNSEYYREDSNNNSVFIFSDVHRSPIDGVLPMLAYWVISRSMKVPSVEGLLLIAYGLSERGQSFTTLKV